MPNYSALKCSKNLHKAFLLRSRTFHRLRQLYCASPPDGAIACLAALAGLQVPASACKGRLKKAFK